MMMKKLTLLALVAALVVALTAGTAVAKPDKGKGKGKGKGPSQVTYIFKGDIAQVTPASVDPVTGEKTGQDTITVNVERGNKAAGQYLGTQTFNVTPETNINVDDVEKKSFSDLAVGQKVVVQTKGTKDAPSFDARTISAETAE